MSGLDLYRTQGEMLWMLVWALATGIFVGMVYDLLRALRILTGLDQRQGSTPLYRVSLFVGDVILAVTAAVALILLCYYTNDGLLRGLAVWGMAGGFFVYVQTLGRLTLKVEKVLARLVRRLISLVLVPLSRPLLWGLHTLQKGAHAAWSASFGKALDRRREKRMQKNADEPMPPPAEPTPFHGETVFSTRRPP